MIQGVLMFGADRRIVVCNRRYLDMYWLSADVIRPGCTLRTLLECRKKSGSLAMEIDDYFHRIEEILDAGETNEMLVDTGDGRTMHVVTQPLPGGAGSRRRGPSRRRSWPRRRASTWRTTTR